MEKPGKKQFEIESEKRGEEPSLESEMKKEEKQLRKDWDLKVGDLEIRFEDLKQHECDLEPCLNPQQKFAELFPLSPVYAWIYPYTEELRDGYHWTVASLPFAGDSKGIAKLPEQEKSMLAKVLAFFIDADTEVQEGLHVFLKPVTDGTVRRYYQNQQTNETLHTDSYRVALMCFADGIREDVEKLTLKLRKDPVVEKKTAFLNEFLQKTWISPRDGKTYPMSFAQRLVAFLCVEQISFCSAFAFIIYLKDHKRGLEGLFRMNDYIMRDEDLHKTVSALLFQCLRAKPPPSYCLDLVHRVVTLEKQFAQDLLSSPLPQLTYASMCDYICYVANDLLFKLGVDSKHFYLSSEGKPIVSCPLGFMDKSQKISRSSFFEIEGVTDYKKQSSFSSAKFGVTGIQNLAKELQGIGKSQLFSLHDQSLLQVAVSKPPASTAQSLFPILEQEEEEE